MLVVAVIFATSNASGDGWQLRAPVPGPRAAHSIVWTGREAIVWGGGVDGNFLNTGARYAPSADAWQVTSPNGAPAARWFHAAVWTGSEMIVWGGRANFFPENHFNDGARYNPTTDSWTRISTNGAPTPRSQCAAVWTGEEMIVWGGETDGGAMLGNGAAYSPATDSWRPIGNSGLAPRMEPTAVWTGSEMIVFGGVDATKPGWLSYGDGARYNPFTDSWTPLPVGGAPDSRTGHTAVWTGERMIVWGGRQLPSDARLNSGASYHPSTGTWSSLSTNGAPQARALHAAVWTGSEMIVWGGDAGSLLSTGARLNLATGLWTPMTQVNAPRQRMFWRPDHGIWTGRGMLVCAGSDYPASLDSTALYTVFDPPCPPVIVEQPQGVTVAEGEPVTLAVGAQGCVLGESATAVRLGQGSQTDRFEFQTGARSGVLALDYDFHALPDSVRVFYEGQLIFDRSVAGQGQLLIPYGPGTATSVEIVMNENASGATTTVWAYSVRYRPPQVGFQWLRNGVAMQGQTNEMLHFEHASLGDAGDYTVLVSGNDGATLSAVATVTIQTVGPGDCAAVPAELVAWWSAEGNSYGRLGTNQGILSGGVTYAMGKVGAAFSFPNDGEGSVKFAASPVLDVGTGDGFTVEGWIRRTSPAPSGPIVEWSDGSRWGSHFWVFNDSLYANLTSPGGGWHAVVSTVPVPVGVWNHVALSYEKGTGTGRLYLNGTKVGEDHVGSFSPETDFDFYLGRRPAPDIYRESFEGLLDEFSLYRRALATNEIAAIHRAGAAGKCVSPNPPATNHVFNLSDGFGPEANPNGPWSYGRIGGSLTGPFELLNTTRSFLSENSVPIQAWFHNNAKPFVAKVVGPGEAVSYQFRAPAGTVYFGANPEAATRDYAVIRFTVPAGAGGRYRLTTGVRALYDGARSADADFHVLRNGVELFGRLVPPNSGAGYSNVVALAAGDWIDFAAGRGTNGLPDTGLKIAAELVLVSAATAGIESVSVRPEGGVLISGRAPSGTVCQVERSTDMTEWQIVGVATETTPGWFEIVDPLPPDGAACFYRMAGAGW